MKRAQTSLSVHNRNTTSFKSSPSTAVWQHLVAVRGQLRQGLVGSMDSTLRTMEEFNQRRHMIRSTFLKQRATVWRIRGQKTRRNLGNVRGSSCFQSLDQVFLADLKCKNTYLNSSSLRLWALFGLFFGEYIVCTFCLFFFFLLFRCSFFLFFSTERFMYIELNSLSSRWHFLLCHLFIQFVYNMLWKYFFMHLFL